MLLVEASPGTPAKVTDLPVTSGRRMRTLEGTVEQLRAAAGDVGDDWLRVRVKQSTYAGLRDDILEALPNALEIHIHPDFTNTGTGKVGIGARRLQEPRRNCSPTTAPTSAATTPASKPCSTPSTTSSPAADR